jgi:hypothetical protein
MRENPKANPGKQPYRENKEGRKPNGKTRRHRESDLTLVFSG